MHPPCPHCDRPDASLLRVVLIGEILRADASLIALLADVLRETGLVQLSETPVVLPMRRQKGTPKRRRRPPTEHA